MINPEYIGDGVYAQITELNDLVLTVGAHHDSPDFDKMYGTMIVFEPTTLVALEQYIARQKEQGHL